VQLFTATEPKDIHFHQMTKSGHRVRQKRVDEKTGREVEYRDIEKGYELSKGKVVLIEPEEIDAAAPEQTHRIDIEDFIDLAEIDPIYFDASYYVAPRKEAGADKAYALLRDSMARSGKVAIGRFVMRTKQYLVAIRPSDRVLVLETLYFSDEVRDPKMVDAPARLRGGTKELKIAEQLIDAATVEWEPTRYEDTYRAEVLKVVRRKSRGENIVAEAPDERRADVVDLVEALQASLDARGKGKGRRRRAS
jgi:DNA end-binding protein Ku